MKLNSTQTRSWNQIHLLFLPVFLASPVFHVVFETPVEITRFSETGCSASLSSKWNALETHLRIGVSRGGWLASEGFRSEFLVRTGFWERGLSKNKKKTEDPKKLLQKRKQFLGCRKRGCNKRGVCKRKRTRANADKHRFQALWKGTESAGKRAQARANADKREESQNQRSAPPFTHPLLRQPKIHFSGVRFAVFRIPDSSVHGSKTGILEKADRCLKIVRRILAILVPFWCFYLCASFLVCSFCGLGGNKNKTGMKLKKRVQF